MDQRAVLEGRVVSLLQELKAAEDTIAKMSGEDAAVVRNRLKAKAEERLVPLKTLRASLAHPADEAATQLGWLNYQSRQKDCSQLFEECLPVLQGLALRQLGWDDGLCRIADRLLTNLANRAGMDWNRITLPAVGEQFRPLPQVIWIRYPAASIWDLPIAAHEMGHYLGPRLEKEQGGKITRPLENLLDGVKDPTAQRFLQEHLGDVFATYTIGPAYACACLLGRFDPATAHTDGREHPSAAKRSYAILKTLVQLDGGDPSTFSNIAGSLRATWNAILTLFGQQTSLKDQLGAAQFQVFDELMTLLYMKIDDRLKSMRYDSADWQRCKELAAGLTGTAALPATGGYSIADVLNVAWRERTADMDQGSSMTAYLGSRALALCQILAQ